MENQHTVDEAKGFVGHEQYRSLSSTRDRPQLRSAISDERLFVSHNELLMTGKYFVTSDNSLATVLHAKTTMTSASTTSPAQSDILLVDKVNVIQQSTYDNCNNKSKGNNNGNSNKWLK